MTRDWPEHNDYHDGGLDALYSFGAASGQTAAATDHSDAGWSALMDYSAAEDNYSSGESAFDALCAYEPTDPHDTATEFDDLYAPTEQPADPTNDASAQLSTVTNPPATVSVTAVMDGRIVQVDLAEQVTNISESELAEEILVLADLAYRKGQATQHTFLSETMHALGANDTHAVNDFLENGMNLSSPQKAAEAQAHVFATRYNH